MRGMFPGLRMPSVPTMLLALRLGLRYSERAEKRAGIAWYLEAALSAVLRDARNLDLGTWFSTALRNDRTSDVTTARASI